MLEDLLGHPDEEGIVYAEGPAQESHEEDHDHRDRDQYLIALGNSAPARGCHR
jgi:hypothetical protein